jgi:hypothetical protein
MAVTIAGGGEIGNGGALPIADGPLPIADFDSQFSIFDYCFWIA